MNKRLTKKQVTELLVEYENIQAQLEGVKPLYKRSDEIIQLLQGCDLSKTKWMMIDNFSDKNTVFKVAGVKRFELKKVA